jgi:hypothetical protein
VVAAEEFEGVDPVGLCSLAAAQLKGLQWSAVLSKLPMRRAWR